MLRDASRPFFWLRAHCCFLVLSLGSLFAIRSEIFCSLGLTGWSLSVCLSIASFWFLVTSSGLPESYFLSLDREPGLSPHSSIDGTSNQSGSRTSSSPNTSSSSGSSPPPLRLTTHLVWFGLLVHTGPPF